MKGGTMAGYKIKAKSGLSKDVVYAPFGGWSLDANFAFYFESLRKARMFYMIWRHRPEGGK